MSSVVISGDSSGAITLAAPAVAGTNTATLPAATGTVMVSGNMPAFSAYLSSNQNTSSGVATKIQYNVKTSGDNSAFDTNGYYDNTTNYRFLPLIAGYYQVNATYNTNTASLTRANIYIYKNGSAAKAGADYSNYTGINTLTASALIYLNGSTDYIEIYSLQTGTSPQVFASSSSTYFQAVLVRN
jgi:hypothetical protein